MPIATGERIGSVNIDIYETQNGDTFFYIQGNNEKIIPMLDYFSKLFRN